jgi:hypothetical protein
VERHGKKPYAKNRNPSGQDGSLAGKPGFIDYNGTLRVHKKKGEVLCNNILRASLEQANR